MPLSRGVFKGLRRKLGTGRQLMLASLQLHNCTPVSASVGFADFSLQIVTADGWSLPPYKSHAWNGSAYVYTAWAKRLWFPEKGVSNFHSHILGCPLQRAEGTWNNSKVYGHYYTANKLLFRCGRKICLQEERSREICGSPEIHRSLTACQCLSKRMRFFKSQAKVSISINCMETSSPHFFLVDTVYVWGVIQILDGTDLAGLAPLFTDHGFVITYNEVTVILLKQCAVWQRQLLGHFI